MPVVARVVIIPIGSIFSRQLVIPFLIIHGKFNDKIPIFNLREDIVGQSDLGCRALLRVESYDTWFHTSLVDQIFHPKSCSILGKLALINFPYPSPTV